MKYLKRSILRSGILKSRRIIAGRPTEGIYWGTLFGDKDLIDYFLNRFEEYRNFRRFTMGTVLNWTKALQGAIQGGSSSLITYILNAMAPKEGAP